MDLANKVFVAGLGGVFIAMAFLYIAIKLSAFITDKFFKVEESK